MPVATAGNEYADGVRLEYPNQVKGANIVRQFSKQYRVPDATIVNLHVEAVGVSGSGETTGHTGSHGACAVLDISVQGVSKFGSKRDVPSVAIDFEE